MKRKMLMLRNALYRLSLAMGLCLAFGACSQEESTEPDSTNAGSVNVLYRVASAVTSRATEDGEDDLDENTVNWLDLFWFSGNGTLKDHFMPTHSSSFLPNGEFQDLEISGLTYSQLAAAEENDVFYLVANYKQSAEVKTLSDLQNMIITPSIMPTKKQESFVMDAKTLRSNKTLFNQTDKTITLKFELNRATAKIRLVVKSENGDNILAKCQYQLLNYVSTGTSVLAEEEDYGKKVGQALAKTDPDQPFTLYNDKAIFYSYPNDWFADSLLTEDGVFEDEAIYTHDDLIDENRQTYFLLKAPYGGNTYYYKVPVNFSIADYNDEESFTKEEIETLRSDYYRLNRNHLYDITVTIDREGGSLTEPVTPKFHILVEDWKEGGSYEISDGEFQEDSEKSGD